MLHKNKILFAIFLLFATKPALCLPEIQNLDELAKLIILDSKKIKTAKSLSAELLKKIKGSQDLLIKNPSNNKQFQKIKGYLAKLKQDPLFEAYALFKTALINKDQAQKLNKASELKLLGESEALLLGLILADPNSAISKKVPSVLQQVEFLLGHLKNDLSNFEKGFNWKFPQNAFSKMEINAIRAYREVCMRKPTDRCIAFSERLFASVSKNPQDLLLVKDVFSGISLPKFKNYRDSEKIATTYKASDLDNQSIERNLRLIFEKNPSEAIKGLNDALKDYPRSSLKKSYYYWLSVSSELLGDGLNAKKMTEKISKEYPLSFYNVINLSKVSNDLKEFVKEDLSDKNSKIVVDLESEVLTECEKSHLKRAKIFFAAGLNEEAAFELKEIRVRETFSNEFLFFVMLFANSIKSFGIGIRCIGELLLRDPVVFQNPLVIKAMFPVDLYDQVSAVAQSYRLDPILVLSLIKQESGFDMQAVSSSGALGLMQLMPFTAAEVNLYMPSSDVTEISNNLKLGCSYLRKMMDKFNNNIVLSLAAYNAGPTAAERWVKEAAKDASQEIREAKEKNIFYFIESIPYKETKDYVNTIIRNYIVYSQLILKKYDKDLSYFWPVKTSN